MIFYFKPVQINFRKGLLFNVFSGAELSFLRKNLDRRCIFKIFFLNKFQDLKMALLLLLLHNYFSKLIWKKFDIKKATDSEEPWPEK